jgi:hypothetical protein
MLVEGMKVYVKSQFLSGEGKVIDISNESYYPVQVEMDQPDEHGHKVFRFYHAEVKPLDIEKEEVDQAPETKTVQLVKIIGGYSLKVGECFTAKHKSKTHYWIYAGDKLRGCFPVKYFSMITVADIASSKRHKQAAVEVEIKPKDPVLAEAVTLAALEAAEKVAKDLEEKEKKKKAKKKTKPKKLTYRQLEEAGQTNIFDFI